MATQKSIEAVLRARDANFSSTFSKATNILSKFSGSNRSATGSIKNIVGALGVYKVASAAASMVTGQFQSALSRSDTMQNFTRNMTVMTGSSSKAKKMLDDLTVATKGTAYGLDSAAKTAQGFSTAGQSMDKATRNTKNFMNAVSFYGNGTNEQLQQVTLQMQQMAAKGRANMGDLNSAVQAGIPVYRMYAEATGQSTEDVMNALSDGKISAEDFFDVLDKVFNEGTESFPKISNAAKEAGANWKGSFDNMKAATTRGVLSVVNSMDTLSTKITGSSIKEHIASLGNIFESNLTSMGNKVQQLGDIIVPYVQIFKTEFSGVGTSVVNATKSVLSALGDMYGGFGSLISVWNFGDALKIVADKIKDASAWIQDHSQQIAVLIPQVAKLVAAYKGLQFISGLALPFVQFGETAAKGIEKIFIGSNSIGGKFTAKFITPMMSAMQSGTESLMIRAMLFSDAFSKAFEPKGLGEINSKYLNFFKGISSGANSAFPSLGKLSNGFKTLGSSIVHPVTSLKTLSASLIATSTAAGGTGTVVHGLGVKASSGFKTMAVSGLGSMKSISGVLLSTAGIFAIVVAAVAAMAVAWTSNFGNIQGFTKSAFAGMKPAFDSIKNSLSSLKPVLSGAGDAFKTIGAVLIGTVVFAIAAVVDAIQLLIANFKSVWDVTKMVGSGIKGIWKTITGDTKGAEDAFNEAGESFDKAKNNYKDVWDNSAIRGTISATSELGKETDNTSNSQKRLSQAMDSTKASAGQLSGTFSKLNQATQDSAQKMQEAFGDNEVMQKFNDKSLKLIEEGGKQRQTAVEKYSQAIANAEGKSENERQGIMQKANATLMADFQKSRSDLLAVNNEYSQMLKSNTDKSGNQLTESQRVALVNSRNAVVEELGTTNQTYIDKLRERIELGDSISKEETNTALTNLRDSNSQQVELINTNNQEIQNLKQAQAQSNDEMEKVSFQQEIINLQNKNQSLTEAQTAFGQNWLALQAAQNQTTAEQLAAALANEKNLTDQNLLGILESYRSNGASVAEQMTIMAAMLQEKGVEGATNLVTALKSGDVKAVGASITEDVKKGLGTLPPGMFSDGEKGRQNFINALKQGDTKAAGSYLKDGVTSETSKTAQKTAQDGKNAADAHNKGVENGKGGAKNAGSSLAENASQGAKTKTNDFRNTGQDAGMNFVHGVEYRRGSAQNAGTSLANSAKNGASSVGGFNSIGSNMALGVADGINASAGSAVAAMQSLVSRVNAEAKKKAEIKSPSRLLKREVGSFLALGVASGIEDKTRNAVNAMRDLIQKTSDVAVQGFDVDLGFSGEIKSDRSSLSSKLDDLIQATREKIVLDGAAIVGGHPDTIDKLGFDNYQDRGRLSF
ncbi:tape measure protein [Lactococcus petauri]|uniref:Tape measure protein n=1 Tax=Lactococcus petauri TaxID=1940789 RepID=A0AAJ2IVR3_9LACT|nr:tape measure protein [Lactococcus petauri]MDT2584194.1 tape measure protein [Lactococcus petauri]